MEGNGHFYPFMGHIHVQHANSNFSEVRTYIASVFMYFVEQAVCPQQPMCILRMPPPPPPPFSQDITLSSDQ